MAESKGSLDKNPNKSDVQQKRALFSVSQSVSTHSLLSTRQLLSDAENERQSIAALEAPLSNRGSEIFLKHLQRHASCFGLDDKTSSSPGDSNNHTIIDMPLETEKNDKPHSLSWKKLQMLRPKLKTASNTSALMAGFAMAAVVEVQLSTQQVGHLPAPLLIVFAFCTSLLVAVHMLVLLISTCILPSMDGIRNLHAISLVNESPHERLQRYIEFAWICSTILGILLFMLEVTIVCWVQFYNVLMAAAYVATGVFFLFMCIFVWFALIFYKTVVTTAHDNRQSDIRFLEQFHKRTNEEFQNNSH